MSENRLIKSLRLKNFLSFGNEGEAIELQPLNVLIGANASGKSNLVETFLLLRSLTGGFAQALRNGGGIGEYISKLEGAESIAEIELLMSSQEESEYEGLNYEIGFTRLGQTYEITNERLADSNFFKSSHIPDFIIDEKAYSHSGYTYYCLQNGESLIYSNNKKSIEKLGTDMGSIIVNLQQSILSQLRDPQNYPQLAYVTKSFEQIKIYKEWQFTQYQKPRIPVDTSLPSDFLLEDAQNLALVLNDLDNKPVQKQIISEVNSFYPDVERINTLVQGSTIQLYFVEKNLRRPVPAIRLSDGTLRFLCLLSILCHPTPPPLICIEEPEIGLHPDMLETIAKLLLDASKRTQLIVTTHSDILVSAIARLSDSPEPILVCERDKDGTHLRRLEKEKLQEWLDEYSLGELWLKGEVGGTRW